MSSAQRPLVSRLRLAAFCLLASFVVLGPAYVHVFRGRNHLVPRWQMFQGTALDLYEVRFETLDAEGGRLVVDRVRELGYTSIWQAPSSIRVVKTRAQANVLVRRLCHRLKGRPVYMRLRRATRAGFRTEVTADQDQCRKEPVPAARGHR